MDEKHQAFIDALFETEGDPKKAAELAGFFPAYGYKLVKSLKNEIIARAEEILALHAPRAAFTLANAVGEGSAAPTNPLRMRAAEQILDRVGLIKKEEVKISGDENAPIFILPAKRIDPE